MLSYLHIQSNPLYRIFQLVWIFILMMYGAYAAATKHKNHSSKIIETMIPQQGKKKCANHIVRLEFCSEFSAG